MSRHIRWSLIAFNTLLILIVGTVPFWLPFLEPLRPEQEISLGRQFECPNGFEAEICRLLGAIDERDPLEAQAMIAELLTPRQPAPADEASQDSMWAPVDRTTMAVTRETLILTGQFTEIDRLHRAQGSANVWELFADGTTYRYVRLEDSFEAAPGPDLRVYLSLASRPRTADEVLSNNTAIDLGALKGEVGAQNYLLDNELDILDYRSVVIFSPRYGTVFSSAELNFPVR